MRTLLIAFATCIHLLGHATPATIDSLRNVVRTTADRKVKLNAIISLCEQLYTKDFDETLQYAKDGMAIATALKDTIGMAKLERHIGFANYFKGRFDEAATHYYAAIRWLEPTTEYRELGLLCNDLAKLYRKTRDLDKALANYDRAMALFQRIRDTSNISMIWNESGVVFEYKNDLPEALRRYGLSLEMATARKDTLGISYALNFIAGVKTIQKRYDEAEQDLLRCIELRKAIKDSFAIALAMSDLGVTYNAAGKFDKAIALLEESNAFASRIGFLDLQVSNLQTLADTYKNKGDLSKAYDLLVRKQSLADSLFSLEKSKQIDELNTKYETARKERTILEQQSQITRKNLWIYGSLAAIVLLSLLGYSYYRRIKLRQEKDLQQAIMQQQDLATKAVIQAEEDERKRIALELHDGVGQMMSAAKMNLSSFEAELDLKEEKQRMAFDRIISLVDDSCKEVRAVSHQMMPNALLKNGLANAIREFVDKIDHRVLKVDLHAAGLQERIDPNVETVLYRVIQECVNNVIKHSGANHLDISLIKDQDGISVTIEDNGQGFDPKASQQKEGIGLKNIRSRIAYLKGTIDIDSAPGNGTLVAIHVPA